MSKPLTYDPNKVELLLNGNVIKGYNSEHFVGVDRTPLDIELELKDIGKMEGIVYLTKDQMNSLENNRKGVQNEHS